MSVRTVLVCEAQVPFVTGGAEAHVRQLVGALRARGYEAELVSVPFTWNPKEEILAHAAAWRLLNLSESNGRPRDRLIVTKFPTHFPPPPQKSSRADPSAPRRLRAVRHAVQRLRARRAGPRAARDADTARSRDA